jgi:hypothetical protein
MPEFIQTETPEGVLDNLQRRAGITAVATSPYVMAPAPEGTGGREPPIDAGAGAVRLLDRPLWGKRELFVRTAPSFTPDLALYEGLAYQPSTPDDLTTRDGPLIQRFVREAKRRGLKVYLQVQAAIPPGYRVQFGGPRDEDAPRLPDGRIPPRRVDKNGSLASAAIVAYHQALLRDLARAYPEIDGFRVDWPEYPPYTLDDCFLDCSAHALAAAKRHGLDAERLHTDALAAYRHLTTSLRDDDLRDDFIIRYPGLTDLARLKALLVDELLAAFRSALPDDKELMPNAFPPPWSAVSGFDYARAARHASAISVKLYTMHWPMMLRFYAEPLIAAGASETAAVRTILRLLDMTDGTAPERLADWRYPEPEEPHPAGLDAQARKIKAAQAAAGATRVLALAHSYGPVEDFRRRLTAAWQASNGGVWVNRYGYLSDAKLDVVGAVTRG